MNDESLDFAHNTDYLESGSYTMDLSGVFWTDRPSESASFKVIDSNSDIDTTSPPPPPPPPPSGGGGPIAGGRPDKDPGETDVAIIDQLPQEDDREDLSLHESAEEKLPESPEPTPQIIPEPVVKPVQVGLVYDDFDGCSAQFEMNYMDTNPYRNDTDKDEVEDCDEDWIYDTNPIVYNDHFHHVGLARMEDIVYTQEKPLFVGRADFNVENSYTDSHVQLEIGKTDPVTLMGMFFLELKEDFNCIGLSEIALETGQYTTRLYRDGEQQEKEIPLIVDTEKKYTPLQVSIPEGGMLNHENTRVFIGGETGEDYGVVAFWTRDEYIDVSATVADYRGEYYLPSPTTLEDGEYRIYVYGLFHEEAMMVQTNYHIIDITMKDGVPYIVENVEKKETPTWKTAFDYAKTQMNKQKIESLHNAAKQANPMYLLSYGIFFTIILISYFIVWRKD
ncbi:hypothetical protein GF369_00780 [Candidatus Peregrinibacteria bacterium]|nr:hypothetical protein [Candidatus Peregrinibacteria bacterium]